MKPHHEKFATIGDNLHDQSGRPAGVCPKCKAPILPKPGFRVSSLKCQKCNAV